MEPGGVHARTAAVGRRTSRRRAPRLSDGCPPVGPVSGRRDGEPTTTEKGIGTRTAGKCKGSPAFSAGEPLRSVCSRGRSGAGRP
jgi:hypothetical protein